MGAPTFQTANDRFSGPRGRLLAIEALKDQRTLMGNPDLTEALFDAGHIRYFAAGDPVTTGGAWANDITFILAGKVQVSVRGNPIAFYGAGQHVGEIEILDPSRPQVATITAVAPTFGLVVSEADFSALATRFPELWRQIARKLADRVRDMTLLVRASNLKPQMFIASSTESLPVATSFFDRLQSDDIEVNLWRGGVFLLSQHAMESLRHLLEATDFAVAIFSPDDKVHSRGVENPAPRDNTVFELGLFAGAIGCARSFYAVPRDSKVKIPSDLIGITSVRYGLGTGDGGIDTADACAQILERVRALGPR